MLLVQHNLVLLAAWSGHRWLNKRVRWLDLSMCGWTFFVGSMTIYHNEADWAPLSTSAMMIRRRWSEWGGPRLKTIRVKGFSNGRNGHMTVIRTNLLFGGQRLRFGLEENGLACPSNATYEWISLIISTQIIEMKLLSCAETLRPLLVIGLKIVLMKDMTYLNQLEFWIDWCLQRKPPDNIRVKIKSLTLEI